MRRKFTLFMLCMMSGLIMLAQNRVVSGKIVDDKGVPVEGATVKVKGSKKAVAADANGNYSISAPAGASLIISGVGLTTQEVNTGNNSTVNISVAHSSSELAGVTVTTALGVKRQARQLGYSTAKVSTEELNQAKVTNVATGLAGKVSGLSVNLVNNGVKPDTRVTLRGNRSILGNNQALLVVDDIQLPIAYINSISPTDVENVTVLKGASASALYGSAASNGVIIVTTKKGNKGKPKITLSSTTTLQSIAYLPKFQNDFGIWSGEFPDQYQGIITLNGKVPYHLGQDIFYDNLYAVFENQSYGARYNGQRIPVGEPVRVYSKDGTFKILQDSTYYSAKPGAKKAFFDKGLELVNSVSYSAGDDKSRFYMAFEDLNSKGTIPGDVNRRDAIRLNGSRESGIFKADYNLGYSLTHTNTTPGSGVPFYFGTSGLPGTYGSTTSTKSDNAGGGYYQSRPLYWQIINQSSMIDLRQYRDWRNNPFASPDGFPNAYYGNPWWQIDQSRLDEVNNDLLGNLSLTLKPTSWLALNYKAGIARTDYTNKYTRAGYNFAPWAIKDTFSAGNIPSSVKVLSPQEGHATSFNQRLTSDFLASLHKGRGNVDATLILGTSLIDTKASLTSLSANALVIPDFYNINNRLGNPGVGEYVQQYRSIGVFADLTLGYKNYLFLHSSLRNDWNSLLSVSNQSYLYPALDASFVFTDAIPALKGNRVLNYGKLRAAYSKTAQVSIAPYSLENVFVNGGGFPYGNTAGFSVGSNFANPDIKPEFSTDKEVGLDLGFLHNRIVLSTALYSTLTINQTIPISVSNSTGFNTAVVNSGVMSNKGIEFDLKLTPVQTRDWRWDVGVSYSYNKNILKSLGYGLDNIRVTDLLQPSNSFAVVGQPYPTIRTSDWLRDPQGRIIVSTSTGLPSLDPTPKYFGTSNPPTKIGLTTSVNFKGFTLSAVADGRFGAMIYNSIGNALDFTGVSAYSTSSGRQPFVIPNSSYYDGTSKSYLPNTNYNTRDGNALFWANVWNTAGSNYVNSADFWKLREVSLSYTFSPNMLKKQNTIKGLTIGVQGRNLLAIRAKDNVWTDPEFSNTTGNAFGTTDINQLPPSKFYGFNVTVTF